MPVKYNWNGKKTFILISANEYTSLEDAVDAVDYVKSQDLAGVMTWDINRDCDQRMNYPAGQVFYTLLDKPNLT